jgi:hypothetical protein
VRRAEQDGRHVGALPLELVERSLGLLSWNLDELERAGDEIVRISMGRVQQPVALAPTWTPDRPTGWNDL